MKNEKCAAVIVCFNDIKCIKKILLRLIEQRFKLKFIIFIDNSDTKIQFQMEKLCYKISKKYSIKIIYISLKYNIGSSGGFALGMKTAYENGADWIWLNDQDGLPHKNCLYELMKEAKRKNIPCIISPIVLDFNNKILYDFRQKINYWGKEYKLTNYKDINEVDLVGTTGMLISKNLIKKIGFYDYINFFVGYEDFDYCFRAKKENYKIYLCKNAIYFHPDLKRKDKKGFRIGKYLPPYFGKIVDKYFPPYFGEVEKNYTKREEFNVKGNAYLYSKYLPKHLFLISLIFSIIMIFFWKIFLQKIEIKKTLSLYREGILNSKGKRSDNKKIENYIYKFTKFY